MGASQLKVWALNLVLCAIVSASFICYAATFRRVGQMRVESFSDAMRFSGAVLFDPAFIFGLFLALFGSVLRIALMRWLGIARTALASELTAVMTLVFAFLIFGVKLRFPQDYIGAVLILAGSYFVTSS